jgi:two-component system sensor histidine kinase/response regulator
MENKQHFFLSNLSHEIRTPLNGIVGYTQLLQQTKLDQTQKLYINSLNSCCIQLVELVNDILDYSKLAMDKVSVNKECFSLSEVFDDVSSTLEYRIKEKRQTYSLVIDKDIPTYIISDKQKLTQIFINLVTNANKFTPVGGRIIVSVHSKLDNVLECTVEDSGIGISKENIPLLFNPFFQIKDVSNSGSGLGLSICKKLVNLLGGVISVDSHKGEGSIFTFTINYEPYEEFKKYLDSWSKILKNKYVLIIDNDIDDRLNISELFFEFGMFPIVCSSGREAMRLISCERYDLSLVVLDSTDLVKKIKEINCEIPIINTCPNNINNNEKTYDAAIQKPVNKFKLLDIVSKMVGKRDVKQFQLNPIDDTIQKKEIRFLIAEDISYNTDILVKMLNGMGYNEIDTVSNGEEAIQKLSQKEYDILLLDLKMPKVNGFEVAKWVRDNGIGIKIIVLTASVLESDKEQCKGMGIKYFLLKPFNMTHVKVIINKIVNGSGNFL